MFIRSLGSVGLDQLAYAPFLELTVRQEAPDQEGNRLLLELELSDVKSVQGLESFVVDARVNG